MLPVILKTDVERYYLQGVEGFLKAEVYVGLLSDGTQVVSKDYSRFRKNPLAALIARYLVQREHKVLSQLEGWAHAPRVFNSKDPLVLLQEYIPGKTFSKFKTADPVVIKSIRKALRELHQKNFIHNDFRASNVIIKADNTAVLIDFTSSIKLPKFMGKVSRWLMLQDLRHAIKFKIMTGEDLTAREQRLSRKSKTLQWLQSFWKGKILILLKGR